MDNYAYIKYQKKYLASKTNRDFILVLKAIFNNKVVLILAVIIKG